jgi:hypothetical protein
MHDSRRRLLTHSEPASCRKDGAMVAMSNRI